MILREESLKYHKRHNGKLGIVSKVLVNLRYVLLLTVLGLLVQPLYSYY